MRDADRLAITRQRLAAGRCVACGASTGRAALCRACALDRTYCPHCEQVVAKVYHSDEARTGRTATYCPPCKLKIERTRRGEQPRDRWLKEQQKKRHHLLSRIIKEYRAGYTQQQIGDRLGIPAGTVRSIIAYARATGRWPKTLTRGKGYRSDVQRKEHA